MYELIQKLPNNITSMIIVVLFLTCIMLFIVILLLRNLMKSYINQNENLSLRSEVDSKNIKALEEQRLKLIKETSNHVNYLNSVFSSMQEGILVFNNDLKVVLANPFAIKVLGLDNSIFFDRENSKNNDVLNKLREMLVNVKGSGERYELIRSDYNDTYLKYSLAKILDKYSSNKELGYFVSIYDVSETEKNNRLRNEFIENISHEFKTPMTIILGYIETLEIWGDLDRETKHHSLGVIKSEVSRLNAMVDRLLSLTKVKGHITQDNISIDVLTLVKSVVDHFKPLAKQLNVKLQLEYEEENIIIFGDRLLLINALSNLIDNAIKYTHRDDSIKIEVKSDGNKCYIWVRDKGPGIEENHLKRLFERFYRIEKDRNSETGGTGLGLAITKDSIESIGGELSVESKKDAGTSFLITLPLLDKEEREK